MGKMTRITDQNLLNELEGGSAPQISAPSDSGRFSPVEDPELLRELNGEESKLPGRSAASKFVPNVVAGLAKMGHNVINAPHDITNYFSPKLAKHIPKQQDYDFAAGLGLPTDEIHRNGEAPTTADKIVQSLAQYAPAFVAPNAALGGAGRAIASIPKAGNYLSRAAEIGAPQAAFGATQNEEDPLRGAEEGAITGAVSPAIEKIINLLRPSQIFRGQLTPEQLMHNLSATKGTETSLGRVIESPTLNKTAENILPHIIGSGAEDAMQRTAGKVSERGEGILSDLLGENSPEGVPEQLADVLSKQYKANEKAKIGYYKKANDLAKEADIKLELPNFAKTARKYMGAINQTNILKFEPDSAKIFNKLKNYTNPVKSSKPFLDKTGLETTKKSFPTLKEANILKGALNRYANTFAKSTDASQRGMAKVFGKLASNLKTDIKETINKSGHEGLQSAYKEAETNYANNFSPFLDKDIYKFISGQNDPATLVQKFIKTSPTVDLGNHLAKLSDKLPENEKKLLGYAYLSRALDNEGNLKVAKLSTAINKLGKKQFETLFPQAELRKQLKSFVSLEGMNKEATNLMFNPKTGARNTDLIAKALQAAAGFHVAGLAGATAAVGGGALASRGLTKALTSEKVREKMIKAMIENKQKKLPNSAIQGAISSLNANKERKKQPMLNLELNTFKGYQ